VSTIVNMQPDMTVVAEASNGHQAVELFRKHRPDVTLLDMRMPGWRSGSATASGGVPQRQDDRPDHYGGDEDIRRALAAGCWRT